MKRPWKFVYEFWRIASIRMGNHQPVDVGNRAVTEQEQMSALQKLDTVHIILVNEIANARLLDNSIRLLDLAVEELSALRVDILTLPVR
jgi:hypothetical protein